jgi:hypothetical protein
MGVPNSPDSSLAPESYSGGSQYGGFLPDDHYNRLMQATSRLPTRRMICPTVEAPRYNQEGRMTARRMASGSMGGRTMGFPPPTGPGSAYSDISRRVMAMRPPPTWERPLMPEASSYSSSYMGPTSSSMTSPYAPGPSRHREGEHIQRK